MSSNHDPYVASLKRSFEDTGLDDGRDGSLTSSGGSKLAHADSGIDKEPDEKADLETLPIEMLTRIASYLSTTELLALRLTSRTIEVKLFNDFAKYYFAKKQFMLTAESLQCLVDISLHPKLSTVLEHVIISMDSYQLGNTYNATHFPGDDSDTKRARWEKYREGAYDQFIFLTTGRDRQLLTEAFRNLRNLKTVGLRDYNNGRRSRDGPGAVWRAYGAGTVLRETGVSLLAPPFGNFYIGTSTVCAGSGTPPDFAARAFATLLQALGESDATPENIEILVRDTNMVLPEHAFHIPQYLEQTVAPFLLRLKSLLLTADLVAPPDGITPTQRTSASNSIPKFLCLVPNLVHLRLNCPGTGDGISSFLTWLANTDADSPTPLLPRLEKLEFGMFSFYLDQLPHPSGLDPLSRVVGRFGRTLKALTFWKTSLKESREQLDALRRDPDVRPNRWAKLLGHLPRLAPGLERLTIGFLYQISLQSELALRIESQVNARVNRGDPPHSRTYRRDDMRDLANFKRMLDKELVLPWDWLRKPSSEESGSEDEDGNGDDDENGSDDDNDDDHGDGEVGPNPT